MGVAAVPLIAAAAGATLGAVKTNQARAAYNRQKEMAAQIHAWSPWTGMTGQSYMPTQRPDQFGDMFGGAMSGLSMGMMGQGLAGGAAPAATTGQTMDLQAGGFGMSPYQQMMQKPDLYQMGGSRSPWMMTT